MNFNPARGLALRMGVVAALILAFLLFGGSFALAGDTTPGSDAKGEGSAKHDGKVKGHHKGRHHHDNDEDGPRYGGSGPCPPQWGDKESDYITMPMGKGGPCDEECGRHLLTIVVPDGMVVDNLVVHKLFGPSSTGNDCPDCPCDNRGKDNLPLGYQPRHVEDIVYSPVHLQDSTDKGCAPCFWMIQQGVVEPTKGCDCEGTKKKPTREVKVGYIDGYRTFKVKLAGCRTYVVNYVLKTNPYNGLPGQLNDYVERERGVYLNHDTTVYLTQASLTTRDLVMDGEPLQKVYNPNIVEDLNKTTSSTATASTMAAPRGKGSGEASATAASEGEKASSEDSSDEETPKRHHKRNRHHSKSGKAEGDKAAKTDK